jgi:hypothetical protein
MKVASFSLSEELDALARHYHHLQVEHQNAQPESSARRRLEDKFLGVRDLLEDGLIDVHFDVTPRGHRALSRRRA